MDLNVAKTFLSKIKFFTKKAFIMQIEP